MHERPESAVRRGLAIAALVREPDAESRSSQLLRRNVQRPRRLPQPSMGAPKASWQIQRLVTSSAPISRDIATTRTRPEALFKSSPNAIVGSP